MRYKYDKVVIIGTGLIGGSAGKALIKKKLAREVVGICRRELSARAALKEKAVTSVFVGNYARNCLGADIVLVAAPVKAISPIIKEIAEQSTNSGLVVTDVGSVKSEITRDASRYKDKIFFVGSHPMAGSERSGVESSDPALFEGSACVITPISGTCCKARKKVAGFWADLGAEIFEMTPDEHDRGVALSSHLPHAVAFALAGTVKKDLLKYLFAGGFRDTSRIASSDPALWTEIFMMNRKNILKVLSEYKKVLEVLEKDIRERKEDRLKLRLVAWKKGRDDIFEKNKRGSDRRSRRKR